MSIIDRFNRYSLDQAETTVATHASDNVVDLGADGDAIGMERYLHILVKELFTSGGAATVQFQLETDDDSAFGSSKILFQTDALVYSTLLNGLRVVRVRVPAGMQRYSRVNIIIGTVVLTAGKFDAWLGDAGDANDFTI